MTDRRDDLMPDAEAVEDSTPGVQARSGEDQVLMDESSQAELTPAGGGPSDNGPVEQDEEPDFRSLYLRELADKDNFRKLMIKKQTEVAEYANEDLARALLPVLDHFNLAIEHGEASEGVRLAFKELIEVLGNAGLREIPVKQGDPFDPQIHHALTTMSDASAEFESVGQVHRRGYAFREKVLRAPEVVVAQPVASGEE
ncbi:MAG: nucleotide exchange factor GrpE [Actinomycetota bacterium]